jgi:demethylmenaquinone methyltransferase/2-methoxy-6-polyprenyl-1,4-benzoquinol methylase
MTLSSAFVSPDAKRRHVRRLFTTIADRYDLITRVLSYGRDAAWKRELLRRAEVHAGDRALDLACGTGDLALALRASGAEVCGLDLAPRMLQLARRREISAGAERPCVWIEGDMTALPFGPAHFDLVTTGYGLRNVPDLEAALAEIARVLAPGGRFVSLDFNRPEVSVVRHLYLGYLEVVGALLGWTLHGDPDTYRYIPASIRRYPGAAGVKARLEAAGFVRVIVVPLLFGLMSLHVAHRDDTAANVEAARVRNS